MTSHRQAFRSSAIIGGASAINMVIGIVKVKALAVLLGPAGIGLMGLYQNVISMTSTLAGCGLESSGVRQLAASADDASTLPVVRRALWMGNLILGLAGMGLLWLLREPVARWVFHDAARSADVGWLGFGLLLTLIAGSQTALLQGLRRIDDLARVSILGALAGATVGILAVYLLGTDGVLWFVLTAPAVSVLVASYYTARLPKSRAPSNLQAIRQQWRAMLKLGVPFMAAGLLMLATQLAVRSIVLHELGLEASGYFQAAWAISMTYVGFVVNAMVMDFYPRLSAIIGDHERAGKLVNEQAELTLLLAGPLLMAMIAFSPWVIHLLYAQGFGPAAEILRWQVLGDVVKVASWPLGFIFLASGRGSVHVAIQLVWSAAYLGTLVLGIDEYGLVMAGVGFGIAYVLLYIVITIVAKRMIGFTITRRNSNFTLILLLAGAGILVSAAQSSVAGYAAGGLATVCVSVYSFRRLNHLIDLTGWLRQKMR